MEASGVNYEVPENLFGSNDQPIPSSVQSPEHPFIDQQSKQIQTRTPSRHPISTFFHIFWKVAAIVCYLFIGKSFVVIFIVCILLLAFDFWTVKNITGRLMVGMRWWNEIKDDGSSEWIFESLEDKSSISGTEKVIFWAALFCAPTIWLIFAVISFFSFSFQWFLLVCVALALSFANIIGYVKCAKDARKKISNMASSYIATSFVNKAVQLP